MYKTQNREGVNVYSKTFNSLHTEIVCTSAIINAEINVICLKAKVSSVA